MISNGSIIFALALIASVTAQNYMTNPAFGLGAPGLQTLGGPNYPITTNRPCSIYGCNPNTYPRPPLYPGYPQFPQIPGYPQFPQIPGYPQFPQIPGYPQFPQIPGYPQFPQIPGYPQFPGFPQIPGYPQFPGYPRYPPYFPQY